MIDPNAITELNPDAVRRLAERRLEYDDDVSVAAFIDTEVAGLEASSNPITREIGRLHRAGYRRAFIEWCRAAEPSAETHARMTVALARAVTHQLVEFVAGMDATLDRKRMLLSAILNQIGLEADLGIRGVAAADELQRRGDS